MTNIQNELNNIKNAIYGKDVRNSIHDAIKTCYDDASVNNDNANMEVKLARGTHNTLNDRLCEVDEKQNSISSQLEQIKNNFDLNILDYSHLVVDNDWTNAFDEVISILKNRFSDEHKGVGTLVIPRGIYKFTKTLSLPYGCKIKGSGKDSTILMPCMESGFAINTDKYTTIEDLTIDGISSNSDCLNINNPIRKSTYNNIAIINFRNGTAIKLNDAYCTVFNWVEVLRCKRACHLTTENNNNISFFACDFVDIYGDNAFEIDHCVSLALYSCTWGKIGSKNSSGDYTGTCVYFKTGSGLNITSNWFEWCRYALLNEEGENIDLTNSHISTGILLNSGCNVNIERCDFYGNGGRITNNACKNVKSLFNRNLQGFSLHYGEELVETQSDIFNVYDRSLQIPKGKSFKVKDGLEITQYPSGGGAGNTDIDLQHTSGNNNIVFKNSKGRINKFMLDTGDFLAYESGRGFACKTPDNSKMYRIWVDNDGSIKTSIIV